MRTLREGQDGSRTSGGGGRSRWLAYQEQAKEARDGGDHETALERFNAALQSDFEAHPRHERQRLLSDIVACRLVIGGPAQARAAVESAKQCVALNDQWAKGHLRLASAYIALGGHSNDACNSLQRAIQLDRGDPVARQMLIRELRRDHRNAAGGAPRRPPPEPQTAASSAAAGRAATNGGEPRVPSAAAPRRRVYDDDDDPPPPLRPSSSSDGPLSWLGTRCAKAAEWYRRQPEGTRKAMQIVALLSCLYVAFGGRFGMVGVGGGATLKRRGNYGRGNAYDRYYYGSHSSPSLDHQRFGRRDHDPSFHNSYHRSQGSSRSGSGAGSFCLGQWNGHLTPFLLLSAGAAYLCRRNGVPLAEVAYFLVGNVLFRRHRGRRHWMRAPPAFRARRW